MPSIWKIWPQKKKCISIISTISCEHILILHDFEDAQQIYWISSHSSFCHALSRFPWCVPESLKSTLPFSQISNSLELKSSFKLSRINSTWKERNLVLISGYQLTNSGENRHHWHYLKYYLRWWGTKRNVKGGVTCSEPHLPHPLALAPAKTGTGTAIFIFVPISVNLCLCNGI